jgi:mono/diheme cytochrome c family protein
MKHQEAQNKATERRLAGMLVEFNSAGALITAAEQVRDAGYRKWDAHSPFPVHGIDEAMGIRMTRLPWLVFLFGVIGCGAGLLLQWWTNATQAGQFPGVPNFVEGYDFIVSGKPAFSLPANIPVIFETTVLLAALAAVFGMLAMNNLPWHHNALLAVRRFKRVTSDRFFIVIDGADPKFDASGTQAFLSKLGGVGVERIEALASPSKLPRALVLTLTVIGTLMLLPPLFVAKARLAKSTEPRIHLVQDMDNQPRFKSQAAHPLFADGRSQRPDVDGTVARGDPLSETPYNTGRQLGGGPEDWITGFPPEVAVTEALVRRGQQRFNIYCSACHGLGGAGNGIVHERAMELDTAGWVAPLSLTSETVVGREHGHIFNSISNGIRSMAPYGDQIPVADRWAIVSYIRALQYSQAARLEDVPEDKRGELR